MNNRKKHFLSALAACIVTVASVAVFPVNAVGNVSVPVIAEEQRTGLATGDNYKVYRYTEPGVDEFYELWKGKNDEGSVILDINSKYYSFECSWEDTERAEFMVRDPESEGKYSWKRYSLVYSAEIDCEGGYGFGSAFMCTDRAAGNNKVELRILEAYSAEDYRDLELLKTIYVKGVSYNVYKTVSLPFYENAIDAIYILRADELAGETEIDGELDVKAVLDTLNSNGYDLDFTYRPRTYVEGLGKKGSIKVTKNKYIEIENIDRLTVPNSDKDINYVYYDGLRYSFWQDERYSNGQMTVYSDGSADCFYNNTETKADNLFKTGIIRENGYSYDEYDKLRIRYRTTVNAEDNYASGVYGWLENNNTEFYVVQFRNSDNFLGDAKYVDTVEIDGVKYDIYKGYAMPLAFDAPIIERYWSVSQLIYLDDMYEGVGDVDLTKHFEAWKKAGLKDGKLYEASAFAESFGKGSGGFILEDVYVDISSVHDKDDVVLARQDGKFEKDGYTYFNDDQLEFKSDGRLIFSCSHENTHYSWDSINKYFSGDDKVYINKKDGLIINYDADVSTECDYYVTGYAYMETEDFFTDIRLCIDDCESRESGLQYAKKVGEAEINGLNYELFVGNDVDQLHSIQGTFITKKYYSICKDKIRNHERIGGYIDVAAHAKAFKDAGYEIGPVKSAAINVAFGGLGKGEIVFKKYDFEVARGEPEVYTSDDLELFQNFLLGEKCDLGGKDFDLNNDNRWDIYDLIELRKTVSEQE